jgi:archaellum component FlaC
MCDSWLKNADARLYYGETLEKAGSNVVYLDKLFGMLEYLRKSSSEKFKEQSVTLRNRFFYNLYKVFTECLRQSEDPSKEEITTMEACMKDILDDLPKPASGLGGFGDILSNIRTSLPTIAKTVTEAVQKNMGQDISPGDQKMMSNALDKATQMLADPTMLSQFMSDFSSGKMDVASMVGKLMKDIAPSADEDCKCEPKQLE